MHDRFCRILEAQAGGGGSNSDGWSLLGCDANESHFDTDRRAYIEDLVRSIRKVRLGPARGGAVASVILDDIGGQIWVVGLSGAISQHRLTPVKLVVTERGCVVAHGIEDINGGKTLLNIGQQTTLHFIAGIHKQHIVRSLCCPDTINYCCQTSHTWIAGFGWVGT